MVIELKKLLITGRSCDSQQCTVGSTQDPALQCWTLFNLMAAHWKSPLLLDTGDKCGNRTQRVVARSYLLLGYLANVCMIDMCLMVYHVITLS